MGVFFEQEVTEKTEAGSAVNSVPSLSFCSNLLATQDGAPQQPGTLHAAPEYVQKWLTARHLVCRGPCFENAVLSIRANVSGRTLVIRAPSCHRPLTEIAMTTAYSVLRSPAVTDETVTPDEETAETVVDRTFDTETPVIRSRSDEAIAESRQNAIITAKIAEEYRGKDTVILDLTEITPIVDFFVISTGATRRQMHAVAEEVDRVLNGRGSDRKGLEGYQESSWILQDYGDIVLHVFTEDMRKLYDLERLWADAPRVEWDQAKPAAAEETPAEPTE